MPLGTMMWFATRSVKLQAGIVAGILIVSVVLSLIFPETKEDITAALDDDLIGMDV